MVTFGVLGGLVLAEGVVCLPAPVAAMAIGLDDDEDATHPAELEKKMAQACPTSLLHSSVDFAEVMVVISSVHGCAC